MRSGIILILTLFTLISCRETPESKFEKSGVFITSPQGWYISEEENFDDEGYYLSIEKDGFDSSGLITFTWVNDSLNLDENIENHKIELKNNSIFENSGLIFDPTLDNKFNKINSLSSSFKFTILGIKHEGIIHSFYGKNRTYVVFKQEAIEDKNKNDIGFRLIEESFVIE